MILPETLNLAWLKAGEYFGVAGYRDPAARTSAAFERLTAGVAAIAEQRVLGDPRGPLLGQGSRRADSQHRRGGRPDGGARLADQPAAAPASPAGDGDSPAPGPG
jgi:hypothetical protein